MDADGVFHFFKQLPICRGVAEDVVRDIATHSSLVAYQAGSIVHGRDEPARAFYVLASGRAKLFRVLPDGKEQTIFHYEPGEPFCLCTAFDDGGYPASVATLIRSQVYRIDRDVFERLARRAPDLLLNVALMLSRRLKEAMERIETLSMRDGGQRLALFLLHLSDDDRIELRMSHRELAKILGLTPEALSRTFRRLSEARLLTVDGRSIRLIDRGGLELASVAASPVWG